LIILAIYISALLKKSRAPGTTAREFLGSYEVCVRNIVRRIQHTANNNRIPICITWTALLVTYVHSIFEPMEDLNLRALIEDQPECLGEGIGFL
jgi:hypothetical protein